MGSTVSVPRFAWASTTRRLLFCWANSKQARVLGLLRRPSGAAIATIMTSTGWQPHSVRGFFAAVVRKKLALRLESEKTDGERVYRIVAGKTSADTAGDQPSIDSSHHGIPAEK